MIDAFNLAASPSTTLSDEGGSFDDGNLPTAGFRVEETSVVLVEVGRTDEGERRKVGGGLVRDVTKS